MDHRDHVHLLMEAVGTKGGTWADFGSGGGAFTLALAELLETEGVIYSIDKNSGILKRQEEIMGRRFPEVKVHYINGDFKKPLPLPKLDGLVAANTLHFLGDKNGVIELLKSYLRPGGRFVVVEYNTDKGNHWVPHPFSYPSWKKMAGKLGLTGTEKTAAVPSSFLGEIYAAVSFSSGS